MPTSDDHQSVIEKTRAILLRLTVPERKLLNAILQKEREYLHQKQPHIRQDLLRIVRQTIKEVPK